MNAFENHKLEIETLMGICIKKRSPCSDFISPMQSKMIKDEELEDEIFRARNIIRNLTDEVVDTKKDRILYCTRICVHPDYVGQRVATEIGKLCLHLGTKQGFTLACGGTGNLISERICFRLGFENRKTININTLENGIFDLSLMNYMLFKFFTKRLGPETILSSKL
nr:uncharacterized protein LOC128703039 [Cherax quadricarinatus]